jgi:hypothetical protein
MKLLKKIGLVLAGLLVLLVLISFFLPSQVHVERSRTLAGPPEAAFAQVNTLKNWETWSPWHRIDPKNTTYVFSEKPDGEGAWYSWKSPNPNVGNGKLTVTKSLPGELVEADLDFEGMGTSKSGYHFQPDGNGTKVTITMDSDMSRPFVVGRYMGLMMDKMLGPDFEKGLANLDSVVAHVPTPAPAAVTVK